MANGPTIDSLDPLDAFSDQREPSPKEQQEQQSLSAIAEELKVNSWAFRARELVSRVEARHLGFESPLVTPWPLLNQALGGGFWPGVHFLVGGTGTGKSQWAMQLAMAAAMMQTPVLYFALELDELGLFSRAASFLCGATEETQDTSWSEIKWSDFYTGKVKTVPRSVVQKLQQLPVHWVVAPPHGWSYTQMDPSVRALRSLYPAHQGPVLVVLDFLQLVASDSGYGREDLRERISRAAYQARALAREQDAIVIVLSSTARDNYERTRVEPAKGKYSKENYDDSSSTAEMKRPHLSDLVGLGKESGDVEYAADSVLVFCPEHVPEQRLKQSMKRVHLAIAKLRAGAPSWVTFVFNGTRFDQAEQESNGQKIDVEL